MSPKSAVPSGSGEHDLAEIDRDEQGLGQRLAVGGAWKDPVLGGEPDARPLVGGRIQPPGVRVNASAAGAVHSIPEQYDMTEGFGKTSLLGLAAQVDDIAEIIAFLASDKASYVTVAVLAADGGRTAI